MKLFERVEFSTFQDSRGTLQEVFTLETTHSLRIKGFQHSLYVESHADVLRGMHFQKPAQGKYIILLAGIVDFFGLDLRAGSPTYGKLDTVAGSIGQGIGRALWLPPGCAFGYRTYFPTKLLYFLSEPRSTDEYSVQFFDTTWNEWASKIDASHYIISAKDRNAPKLAEYTAKGILPLL